MPTPTGLAPNGSTEGAIPVLSWDRVTGATSYGVQVSTSPTFSPTPLERQLHREPAGGPDRRPPRRAPSTGGCGPRAPRPATGRPRRSPAAPSSGPTPLTPADGASLPQPPAAAAELDARERGDRLRRRDQPEPDLHRPGHELSRHQDHEHGRAEPAGGHHLLLAGARSRGLRVLHRVVAGLRLPGAGPAQRHPGGPGDRRAPSSTTPSWTGTRSRAPRPTSCRSPPTQNFNTIVHALTGITGTSYARPATLNNDQYYWRVRAVGVTGDGAELDRPADLAVPARLARPARACLPSQRRHASATRSTSSGRRPPWRAATPSR